VCAAFGCIALAGTACGVLSPEEQLLTEFFEASKVYDTSVMARLSAKPLNPRTDGVIEAFEIEQISRLDEGREMVTVAARVRGFDGQRASRQLVMTLASRGGRWHIEDFR
jgi:hypothetical protein